MFGIFDGVYSYTSSRTTSAVTSSITSFSTSYSTTSSTYYDSYSGNRYFWEQKYINGNWYERIFFNNVEVGVERPGYSSTWSISGYTYYIGNAQFTYSGSNFFGQLFDYTRSNTTSRTTSTTTSATTSFTTSFDVDFYV